MFGLYQPCGPNRKVELFAEPQIAIGYADKSLDNYPNCDKKSDRSIAKFQILGSSERL